MYYIGSCDFFFYGEGVFFFCYGNTGICKAKALPFYLFFMRRYYFIFFFSFFYPIPCVSFLLMPVRALFFSYFFSVLYGYYYKFKFESRLYRLRYKVTSLILRLGYARKLDYCLPITLYIRAKRKKSIHFYYTLRGVDIFLLRKIAYQLRSFRAPNMYSRLGIFFLPESTVFREGIKRMRV